jgi:enamine deaminase RidA (YjgF/YER057c/UK114 family)
MGCEQAARWWIGSASPGKASGGAFREFFSGDATPASTWVGVAALADPGFLIEIEAIAVID